MHLAAQASALGGWESHRLVSAALDRVPFAFWIEMLGVYLPLLLHAALGFWRASLGAAPSPAAARSARLLQQTSAVVLAAFLVFHLWHFRFRLWTGEIGRGDIYPELCASLSSTVWGGVPLVAVAYLIGTAAAAFHVASGLYRASLAWRWVAARRQRSLGLWCVALGCGLFVLGALIVIDLATGSVVIRLPA